MFTRRRSGGGGVVEEGNHAETAHRACDAVVCCDSGRRCWAEVFGDADDSDKVVIATDVAAQDGLEKMAEGRRIGGS